MEDWFVQRCRLSYTPVHRQENVAPDFPVFSRQVGKNNRIVHGRGWEILLDCIFAPSKFVPQLTVNL